MRFCLGLLFLLLSYVESHVHVEVNSSTSTNSTKTYDPFNEFHWHSLRIYVFGILFVVGFVIVKCLSEHQFSYCRILRCFIKCSKKDENVKEKCSQHCIAAGDILPESAFLVTAGILCALPLLAIGVQGDKVLSPSLVFQVMLAPIVMGAAWTAEKLVIYRNLGTILVFAIFGTIINSAIIAPLLYYGSANRWGIYGNNLTIDAVDSGLYSVLICAVDPVAVLSVFESMHIDKLVHNVVFGESLLNDGVAVVFYNAFSEMKEIANTPNTSIDLPVSIGMAFLAFIYAVSVSIMISVFAATLISYVSKLVHKHEAVQLVLVLGLNYLTFICADLAKASGIITLFFSVLCQRQYVQANLSDNNNHIITVVLSQLSIISEGVIFILMGVTAFSSNGLVSPSANDYRFSVYLVLICYFSRFLVVYVLGFMCNLVRKDKLDYRKGLFIQAHGGLRGAIGYSLAMLMDEKFENRYYYRNSTAIMVLFSVYFLGVTIKPLVKVLDIKIEKMGHGPNNVSIIEITEQTLADDLKNSYKLIQGSISIRERWENWYRKINNLYLKHWLMADVIERNFTHSGIIKRNHLEKGTIIEIPQKIRKKSIENNVTFYI